LGYYVFINLISTKGGCKRHLHKRNARPKINAIRNAPVPDVDLINENETEFS